MLCIDFRASHKKLGTDRNRPGVELSTSGAFPIKELERCDDAIAQFAKTCSLDQASELSRRRESSNYCAVSSLSSKIAESVYPSSFQSSIHFHIVSQCYHRPQPRCRSAVLLRELPALYRARSPVHRLYLLAHRSQKPPVLRQFS